MRFKRLPTLQPPSTTDTVNITVSVPLDRTYLAFFFGWVAHMGNPDSWYQSDEAGSLTPNDMADLWTDVLLSETRV